MDTCMLCKSNKKDDIQYGEFLKNKNFGVHTFCLYLSSNLSQNGEDDEGFLGFLEDDIKQEVKRISLLKCCYCHKKYANIGCCERKCRRTFHFICGLKHNAENQFCRDFRSYCHSHVRKIKQRPSPKETCLICYDNLCNPKEKFNTVNMILTPCCRNGWFHKLCLQKFAKTAGYFFKCPLCNDSNIFREKLPSRGIFIPNQDAAWELEPNAFAELLERPSECSAQECKNKKGRKASSENNPFILCSTCGSTAMHRQCLPNGGQRFHCADCTIALEEGDSGRESLNINHDDDENDEDDYVDVCNVSDKENCDIINRLIGNKSDSGSQDHQTESSDEDDIIPKARRQLSKSRKITESSSEENDVDFEENIKTSQNLKINHLAKDKVDSNYTTSDGSDSKNTKFKDNCEEDMDLESETDDNIKPCNVSQTRRLKSDSEDENDYTEDEIKPRSHRNIRRLKTDSESSATSGSTATSLNNFEENDADNEIESVQKRRSTEEEIVKPTRKRKSLNKLFDTDDEEEDNKVFATKHKPLEFKNKENDKQIDHDDAKNRSLITEDSDEDDDPLENFSKIIEKQKNISCIALRTRRSHLNKSPQLTGSQKENKENEDILTHTKSISQEEKDNDAAKQVLVNDKKPKKSKFVKLKDDNSSSNILDISCIAKRTRRKSMSIDRNIFQQQQQKNHSNVPCTRRKTICASTNYSQKSLYEMSQIYEKLHESDEEREPVIEEETEPESETETETETESDSDTNDVIVDTDLDNFIVDDGYEEKDSKFEISCIANRTRKRKSLNVNNKRLKQLEEEAEDSCSSTTSTATYSSTSTSTSNSCSSNEPVLNNVNLRKRYTKRLSSDEFETPANTLPPRTAPDRFDIKPKTISSSLLLDKLPQTNYTAFLKPKCITTSKASSSSNANRHNYHPANHYSPHCNNRKRF